MQITIDQTELEVAVRDYIAKIGLNLPVTGINFTAARSQGGQIVTEIELGTRTAAVTDIKKPSPLKDEAPEPVVEAEAPAPVETAAAPVEEPAPVVEEAAEEVAIPAGKSLFS